MKKRNMALAALALSAVLCMTACGGAETQTPVSTEPVVQETETTTEVVEEVIESVAEINYSNVNYDFTEEYNACRDSISLVPEAAEIGLSVAYESGASGACIVASSAEGNTSDYYLNTFVANVPLTISGEDKVVSATSSKSGDLEVAEDGSVTVTLAPIAVANKDDEVISVTTESGAKYDIHAAHDLLSNFEVTGDGVADADAGVYTFAVDKFMLRMNTAGELIYARNYNCTGEVMAENFAPHITADGMFFTAFIELQPKYRNANGGYSSGFYSVMDENYVEIDEIHLLANDDPNHTHGEGFLDQHEMLVLGANHYMTLSYTLELVENLPENVPGIDGSSTGYVWAGVFQEVKDGKVIKEINTTDYPLLYESAVEKLDYANSTLDGVTVVVGQNEVPSFADGIMDYVHVNSLDYTLDAEGNTDKLLVSMRDQSAVYQFDFDSGAIEWILGGKASTLTGYDEFTTDREDEMGNPFKALTFGQHFARYCNKNADGTLTENPIVSIFDNQTGVGPFVTTPQICPIPTLTRVFKATIDNTAKTATISEVIDGLSLNEQTGKYHIASHCGSVQYDSATSVTIGWGLHGVIDNIGAFAPEGTIVDPAAGFMDLRQGSRPVFTDYDPSTGTIMLEVTVTRNPGIQTHEGLFSYRTYKTAK